MSGPFDKEKPQVGTHHFDDRANVLYDLVRGITVHLKLTQVVQNEPEVDETREYSIAEIHAGVQRKLKAMHDEVEEKSESQAEEDAEQDPDLVLVSFYGFLAAPSLTAMLTGFHNSWLQGYYVAKLLKNRGITVSCSRGKITDEERQLAKEKIRDAGFEPYDPRKHGPGPEEGSAPAGT